MGVDGINVLKSDNDPVLWHLAKKDSEENLRNVCDGELWTEAPQNAAVKLCRDCVHAAR